MHEKDWGAGYYGGMMHIDLVRQLLMYGETLGGEIDLPFGSVYGMSENASLDYHKVGVNSMTTRTPIHLTAP
jgi:hypothetical protein